MLPHSESKNNSHHPSAPSLFDVQSSSDFPVQQLPSLYYAPPISYVPETTPVNLEELKKEVTDEIGRYHSWWKLRLFGHHHGDRAVMVKEAIQYAESVEEIGNILQNQQDLFSKKNLTTECKLSGRYRLFKHLKNKEKGGYSAAIDKALEVYNRKKPNSSSS